jgi:hypothetical protein
MTLQFLTVTAVMFLLDFVWAEYIKLTADGKAMPASCMAVAIMMASGYVTKSYVDNPWLLIAVAIGAFTGTYASIWWKKRRAVS